MCATCWSQGLVFVGSGVGVLRVAAARASRRRGSSPSPVALAGPVPDDAGRAGDAPDGLASPPVTAPPG